MSASQRTKGASGEEWRDVVSCGGKYLGRYQVSNSGLVRAHPNASIGGMKPGRVLFQSEDNKGYKQVILWLNRKPQTLKVHRIVAETFLGVRPENTTVNHIDGKKENNDSANLEFVSNKENTRHAHRVIEGRSFVLFNGDRMSLSEAVERFAHKSISAKAASRRISRLGWPIEKAFSVPLQPTGRPKNGQIPA